MRLVLKSQCDKSLPGSLPPRALEGNSENVFQLSHSSWNESTIHEPCLIYYFSCLLEMNSSHCLQKVFRGSWAKYVISEKRSGYPFTTANVCLLNQTEWWQQSLEIQYWTHYRLWNQIIMLLVLGCKDNTIFKIVANSLHQDTKMDSRATLQTWLMHVRCCEGFYFTCFSESGPKTYFISQQQ